MFCGISGLPPCAYWNIFACFLFEIIDSIMVHKLKLIVLENETVESWNNGSGRLFFPKRELHTENLIQLADCDIMATCASFSNSLDGQLSMGRLFQRKIGKSNHPVRLCIILVILRGFQDKRAFGTVPDNTGVVWRKLRSYARTLISGMDNFFIQSHRNRFQ